MVTGESLYDEGEEEEEEEDEDYLDLLCSAAELDEAHYFYASPDGSPVPIPVGEMDEFYQDSHLLQHYGVPPNTVGPSPAGYDSIGALAPQNSPYYTAYESQLGANHGAVSSSPYPPRPMSRADNPLASPGMLFDRELDQEVESNIHTSISARHLMSSLEDPLAMYNSSFKAPLNMDQGVDYEDSAESEGYSPAHPRTNYPAGFAVLGGGIGQNPHRSRVGF